MPTIFTLNAVYALIRRLRAHHSSIAIIFIQPHYSCLHCQRTFVGNILSLLADTLGFVLLLFIDFNIGTNINADLWLLLLNRDDLQKSGWDTQWDEEWKKIEEKQKSGKEDARLSQVIFQSWWIFRSLHQFMRIQLLDFLLQACWKFHFNKLIDSWVVSIKMNG